MSGNFFSKFDSEYFSLIIFLKYLLILLLILIFVTKMTLLEKNKICRTFRAVGHLGTLQTWGREEVWRHSYVVSAYYRYATIPDTILPYPVLPCEIFLRVPVKVMVQVLAAGCQLSYRKFYGFFVLQCRVNY